MNSSRGDQQTTHFAALEQFKREIRAEMAVMRADLLRYIDDKVAASDAGGKQIVVLKRELGLVIKAAQNEISTMVLGQVMPQIDALRLQTNYLSEDGDSIVDSYRREVYGQGDNSGRGDAARWKIGSADVGTLWGE